jgi:hypothetical protein
METFTKWFYLIGSIISAISILTYFLYKAKTLSPNGKSERESVEFYWSLFRLVVFHILSIIVGILMVREHNHNNVNLSTDITFSGLILIFFITTVALSRFEIIDDYIKNITEIKQNQLMRQSIKI